jgi:hypothetical protein
VHDAGVDVWEVVFAQVHGGAHDLAPVVGDAPVSGARDPGDLAVRMQPPEAAADLRAGLLRVVGTRALWLSKRGYNSRSPSTLLNITSVEYSACAATQ